MASSPSANHLHRHCVSFLLFVILALLTSHDDVIVGASHVALRSSSLGKPTKGVEEADLKKWLTSIIKQQFNATTNFTGSSPATIAGLFPCEVHVNFQGETKIAALRDDHVVPDLSSLATLLTLGALVESSVKATAERVPTTSLVQAMEALVAFRSPSFGETHSALTVFWPVQTKGSLETWTTSSVNAIKGGVGLNPFLLLRNAVKDCQDKCPLASEGLRQIQDDNLCLQYFNESLSDNSKRHNFPPDVASSFANLALGVLLHISGADDPSSSVPDVIWKNKNANMSRLVDHAYQFAYRPLSSNVSNNVIDSRMYYIIEEYLSSQHPAGVLDNASFVTYWVPQTTPGGRVVYGGRALPTYNTLDLFATSTFLYALTSAVLHKMVDYGHAARTLMESNLNLITWIVTNPRKDNLDLLMTSHPSTFQFYWMLSRTMFELEKARVQGLETYKLFQDLYSPWNKTVRRHVTDAILNVIQDGGLDGEGKPLAYVDGLMPPEDGEQGDKGKEPIGNDRLFSTASAANSLLAAWTVHNKQHRLMFLPDTPVTVKLATKGLMNYVMVEYLKKDASYMNVIHSTQLKHCQSLPCCFPSNSVVTQNGSTFSGPLPSPDTLFGMRGRVSGEEYDAMLLHPHCGPHRALRPLPGTESASAPFFFWSAPVYTQATCLLAAALMKNLDGQVKSMEELMGSFQGRTSA